MQWHFHVATALVTDYKGRSFSGVTPSWRSELLFKPRGWQQSEGSGGWDVQMASWLARHSAGALQPHG